MHKTDCTTIPVPPNEAQVAFEQAAKRAKAATVKLVKAARRHPSVTLALADVEAAQDELDAARTRLQPGEEPARHDLILPPPKPVVSSGPRLPFVRGGK